MGATLLHPVKTLDCSVGTGYCSSWAIGSFGQGGNPDGVLYHCRVGACTCATVPGAAMGALTLPCELISLSSTIFTVGCPLICHKFPRYGIMTISASLLHHSHHCCVQSHAQLVGPLSTTTSFCHVSIHWFLIILRMVLILHFQRLRAFFRVRHRCTLCSLSNNCFLSVGCTSDVF